MRTEAGLDSLMTTATFSGGLRGDRNDAGNGQQNGSYCFMKRLPAESRAMPPR